ncbi:MAG: hypothetical protein HOW73_43645 [Polyangiaceae bacterium]|nr:hypothetical protein [Polyangiaceae bacterium]
MSLRSFQEEHPVELSHHEWEAKSKELASTVEELAQHQESAKAEKAKLTAEEKRLERKISDLAECVTTRKESRPVECREEVAAGREVIEIVRCDTGEVVRTRPMTPDELAKHKQGRLFGGDGYN